jgi:hypothetical protein
MRRQAINYVKPAAKLRQGEARPTPNTLLNIVLGADFLLTMLDGFGVEGWNRWVHSMVDNGFMPLCWSEHDDPPPLWYWLDFDGADLSGRDLDGIDLGLAWCRSGQLVSSSLVGAKFGCCHDSVFRGSDLRGAAFVGDVSRTDFRDALLNDIRLNGTPYDLHHPPIGLPAELLRLCRPESSDVCRGPGPTEYPVSITASLAATT